MTGRLNALNEAGQAVWLDFVDRTYLADGELRTLVRDDAVTGVTSNPSIFEKAMGHTAAYDEGFRTHLGRADASVVDTYEAQAIADIQAAADDLMPVYEGLAGRDGYVSLEVSPYLAMDTDATIAEAKRLWAAVDRPNLMVKVPGTDAGTPAIRQLIADGLNINVTLLFSQSAYQAVAEAFLAGLEARVADGQPIDRIASVASFFVSRIDTVIDGKIDDRIAAGHDDAATLKSLRGKVAIANAKLAYAWYQEMIGGERWQALAKRGAMPQRLLWASTGVKDPDYPDTLYVDQLIGPDTVNTMPPKTMEAFRDRGTVGQTLTADVDAARAVLDDADRLGLDLDQVTSDLVDAGVQSFSDAADQLLGAVADKRAAFLGDRLNGMTTTLPSALQDAVDKRLAEAASDGWSRRLWDGDATLWTGTDEGDWVGWLTAARGDAVDLDRLEALSTEARSYSDAVLLGMGGSSLGPEVLARMFGDSAEGPTLHVLDTTDPDQIAAVRDAIEPADTLFIVSSKSGSTLEPELLRAYFWEQAGGEGGHFVAVTDPGSKLEAAARDKGFAHLFHGEPSIGGRYSVLSNFGLVPAAILGLDVRDFVARTQPMVLSCGPDAPPAVNPGVRLGIVLGEAARAGRDKLTILPSPGLAPIGAWLEQLLAESTGKQGVGIVPVDGEPIGTPDEYGTDRLFVHLHLAGDRDEALEDGLTALAQAGQPVVRITVADPMQIGQEFVRWEVATAIAGAVLGIDPFNQPDVEDAKVATRKLVDAYETSGTLEEGAATAEDADLAVFAGGPDRFAAADPTALLAAHLSALTPGRYFGVLAYLARDEENEAEVTAIRRAVMRAKGVATVAGFGPRFLHSTGQAYKGGPKTGVFLVVTRDADPDLAIPDHRASFGTVQLAQALGDTDVLRERGQRVLRVHLKSGGGMSALRRAVESALNT